MRARSHSGFTLIELSIVLVIIGLLAGGVLVGRDLIKAAEIRSAVSSIEEFEAAKNTFRLKYSCLPGDCANGAQYGFVARTNVRGCGNGDGIIGSMYTSDAGSAINALDGSLMVNCAAGTDESQLFWSDLSLAQLIGEAIGTGTPAALPVTQVVPNLLQDTFVVAGNGDMNSTLPPFGYTLTGYPKGNQNQWDSVPFAPLSTSEAYAIDSKMDNADPINGKVYTLTVVPSLGTSPNKGAMAGCSTASGATGTYDLTTTTPNVCVIKIKGS
jgi:prepilin-type N-terminal cleavage/methylation domain-containing protein